MKKRAIDLTAACIFLAAFATAWLYPEQVRWQPYVLWISVILAVCCLLLAVWDLGDRKGGTGRSRIRASGSAYVAERITEAVLLSEEDTELMSWDMYGKTSLAIGRDVRENQVDIDLSRSTYASMVDIEHAVLNYSAGNWYVEDLGSANGISVKKADNRVYRLFPGTPCRLERGDCLNVGLNRLLLR